MRQGKFSYLHLLQKRNVERQNVLPLIKRMRLEKDNANYLLYCI